MDESKQTIYFKVGEAILAQVPLSMVLTDPRRDDNPIVYVNGAFEQLTGYAASYVVGRNCRFLQGDDRDQKEVETLAQAIAAAETTVVTLRNYRLDGTAFRNRLMISPVHDDDGELLAFIGIQTEVVETQPHEGAKIEIFDDKLQEMQHRVKNHLQMISSLIRMQAREVSPKDAFRLLSRRVDALALLYDEFTSPPHAREVRYDVVSAGGYVSRVAATVGSLDGRRNVRMSVDADPVYMRSERAAQLGLMTSEILSNTLQHAFEDREEGLVTVTLKQGGGDRVRLTVSDDGVGMNENWPEVGNLGARIVRSLVRQLDGELNVITSKAGSLITVNFGNPVDTSLEDDGTRVIADVRGTRAGNGERPRLEGE